MNWIRGDAVFISFLVLRDVIPKRWQRSVDIPATCAERRISSRKKKKEESLVNTSILRR